MNWLSRIFDGSVGTAIEKVSNIVDDFHLNGEEKQKFKLEMEALLQKRDSEIEATIRTELQAKERILIAELTQGDKYTKRARPSVVYAGLAFIFFNYCFVPVISRILHVPAEPLSLPNAFWGGWSGIVATWTIGRTFEKRGIENMFTRVVTGSKGGSLLLEDIDMRS